MTKREFLNLVIAGKVEDEVIEFATNEIARLDSINEKRRETVSKKAAENAPLMEKIYDEILSNEPKTATDVSEEMELSVQKCSVLLRGLVKEGKATVTDVKIPKKGTQKGYTKNFTEN